MFRKLYNQVELTGVLQPDGPVLIVQGGGALDPIAPDLAFVRSPRGASATVYLPGSSLKGVLRAHAERLLATAVGLSAAENPFEFQSPRRKAAHERRDDDRPAVYRLSCEADRLFGSTEVAGRFRIGDCYPTPETEEAANRTEIRYGVAIDRAKQSVQVGPFEQEAVTQGDFQLRATLENYELWMLALVLQVFRDLHEGLIQIGHAKSRGFGSVRLERPRLRLRWPGAAPGRLLGAGACERDAGLRAAYGLDAQDAAEWPAGGVLETAGLFGGYTFQGWQGGLDEVQRASGACWESFLLRAREEARHGA